jgi:CubicO group peptidase (beta-lactamase class C family)
MKFALSAVIVLLLSCCSSEQESSAIKLEERIARIENGLTSNLRIEGQEVQKSNITDRLHELNIPGVSIAFAENGQVSWARAYGLSDVAQNLEMSVDTMLLAGSISKPVSAVRALQLVEDGLIKLDHDINAYLTSWSVPENNFTAEEKVTLRRILNHTAGLTVWGFPGYDKGDQIPSVVEVLEGEGNTDAVRVYKGPGESWQYSGGGYTVMQLAITDTLETQFPETMRTAVLQPMSMANSTFENPLPDNPPPAVAIGYRENGEEVEGGRPIHPEMAAAGLWTTPADLIQYAIEIQRISQTGQDGILNAATVAELLQPGMNGHGLGPVVREHTFGHEGANVGFQAQLIAWKDQPYAAVVMVNSENGTIIREILLSIASEYNLPGVEPVVRKIADLEPGALQKFVGKYGVKDQVFFDISVEGTLLTISGVGFDYTSLTHPQSDNEFFDNLTGEITSFEIRDEVVLALERKGVRFVRFDKLEELD